LAGKSWNGLWGDILSSDFPDGNGLLGMDIDAASGTSIHNVEEGIEWWATQSMPLMIDPLLDLDKTASTPLPPNIPVSDSTIVSYGMVS
jgi:hypothetical protein